MNFKLGEIELRHDVRLKSQNLQDIFIRKGKYIIIFDDDNDIQNANIL